MKTDTLRALAAFIPFVAFIAFNVPAARAQEGYLAPPSPAGLLLWDRPDPGHFFETEISTAQGSLDEALDKAPIFQYSQERWNRARRAVETGTLPRGGPGELPPLEAIKVSTEAPSLPPPEVELPEYGTKLSVTGRKIIGFNFSSKRYLKEQETTSRPRSVNLFDINQQLQIRMQGKIGPKISVNVDYDDTKPDKQDISVIYQGDPQEMVQMAAFGDINLSLPSTEFVSYNKQLFGIRIDMKYKGAKFTFVGSRTKGKTKVKQFVGNTRFQGRDILDTQYMRRKYYDLTFGNIDRLPIKQGTEKVYLDNQRWGTVDNINIFDFTVDDLGIKTSSYTGRFKLLAPGVDYTVDYVRGILTFRNSLNQQDVVAVDFQNKVDTWLSQNPSSSVLVGGGTGNFKLIKTENDIYISSTSEFSELGWRREIKTYYSIGQTQIIRDDGRGNFTLKVQDLNRNDVGNSLNPVQAYPDTIEVDFEQGIFWLKKPFAAEDDSSIPDTQVYAPTPRSKRIIRVEYHYRFKTFMLEFNIVVHSETILIDGVKMTRNLDYFIDYDSGFITFYYEDRIRADSVIDITYDVSPFGGLGTSSLIGGRLSYDFGSHVSIGSTLLYETAAKTPTVPNITDLAKSLLVYEGDIQFKNIKLLPGLNSNWSAEVAQSKNNPNLNGFALIENMEGVKEQDSTSLDHNYWYIASNPGGVSAVPSAISWVSQDEKVLDINPNAQADASDEQQVLNVTYDFSVSPEVSIVYPFSDSGLDFSKKTVLELVIKGDGSNTMFNIHLGQINEDADGDGGHTCPNGRTVPETEDINCDGQLQGSEDIGWEYSVGETERYEAGNGRTDTEDLNHNGRLDSQGWEGGSFGYVPVTKFTDNDDSGAKKNTIDFTGWHTLQIPLNIASTETYKWAAIRQARISFKIGASTTGVIQIARIGIIGNTWDVKSGSGTISVVGVNNADNPGYTPIFSAGGEATQVFEDLYGSMSEQKERLNAQNLTEQSLAIEYDNITSNSTVYAYRSFPRAIDISQHKQFRFLLNNRTIDPGAEFFLRVGNENDYHEISIPLDASNAPGWKLYTIEQADLTGNEIPDVWLNASNYTVTISSKGKPNLQQVGMIIAGVRSTDAGPHSGTVWLNEIYVAKPRVLVGNARKIQGDFDIAGWARFGGKYRYVDRNFQTPVTVVSNQDNEQNSGYLDFSRIKFFPMSFNISRQITTTPNTRFTGENNLVDLLQQGKVTRYSGSAKGNFTMGALPRLGMGYSRDYTKYHLLTRHDDKNSYNGTLNYNIPLRVFFMPKTAAFDYSLSRIEVSFKSLDVLRTTGYYNSEGVTENYGVKLSFIPWKNSTFNPNYSLSEVRETKIDFSGYYQGLATAPSILKYQKSMNQTVGFNSNFRLLSWLNPGVNYTATIIENNNLNVTTVTVGNVSKYYDVGDIKTIFRNASGGVNLSLNVNQLLPKSRLWRSMTLSAAYQIQDGDSWENVENSFKSKTELWVRTPLKPGNDLSQRKNLTLRDTFNSTQRWKPLEAYGLGGRLNPLRSLSLTNNYNESIQRSETTGTKSRTESKSLPDLLVSMRQIETLLFVERWMSGTNTDFKYSRRTNKTVNVSLNTDTAFGSDLRFLFLKFLDTAFSYNAKTSQKKDLRLNEVTETAFHKDATIQGTFDMRKVRLTPKVDYSLDRTVLGTGITSRHVTVITPSLLIRADLELPRGIKLPLMKRPILLTNRIIWTTNATFAIKRSSTTIADNTNLLAVSTSVDYEIAKNLRITLNAALGRLWHKFLKQEDYISYQVGSTLTFQF